MNRTDSTDLVVDGFDSVENIYNELLEALNFLSEEIEDSDYFNGLKLNPRVQFPEKEKQLFFNVINAQAINIIPFLLKNIFEGDDLTTPIFLTDEIRMILESSEVIGDFPLRIEDFFFIDRNNNIVISLRFKGKIYKQLRFDNSGKWQSTSSIFYNKDHIFECIREGEEDLVFRVVDNNDVYLFSDTARENFDRMEVKISDTGFSSSLVRQTVTDDSDFPICVEEVLDIRNPRARRISAYKEFNSIQMPQLHQKILAVEIVYKDEASGYIANTKIETFDLNVEKSESSASLSKFVRFYNDLFEETSGEIIRNLLRSALVYRSVTRSDLKTNLPIGLKLHLNYRSPIDIEINNDKKGMPFSIIFMGKWYRVFEVAYLPSERMIYYLDRKREKGISFNVVDGFPQMVRLSNMY
ncbi:MAG: hypothetical protein ACMG57_04660 [Candidatus Dojkabacteria bacterium]